jgi:hypothetical protein
MFEIKVLAPLLAVLTDLIAWLKAEEVAGVVIGGLAASLLGRPRLTRDVDVLVVADEGRWAGFLATGAKYGFVPRQRDTLTFAQQSRVLLVRHEPSGPDADVIFGSLPFERETVAQAVWIDVGGVRVPLPRPEDLIILKAVAHPHPGPGRHRGHPCGPATAQSQAGAALGSGVFRGSINAGNFAGPGNVAPSRPQTERIKQYKEEASGRVSHLQPPLSSAKKGEAYSCSSNWAN